MIKNGEYYLITSDNWFCAPDGNQYRAAWGKCTLLTIEDVFNFKPLRPSTNWFIQVGIGEDSVIIAGCQIHFAIKSSIPPTKKEGTYRNTDSNYDQLNNSIWFAEAQS